MRRKTRDRAAVNQCVVGVATGARQLTSSIGATASTTGVATSSARLARERSRSTDAADDQPCLEADSETEQLHHTSARTAATRESRKQTDIHERRHQE